MATAQYPHLRKRRPSSQLPSHRSHTPPLRPPSPLSSLSASASSVSPQTLPMRVGQDLSMTLQQNQAPSQPRLNIHICEMWAVASNTVPFDLHPLRLSSKRCSRQPHRSHTPLRPPAPSSSLSALALPVSPQMPPMRMGQDYVNVASTESSPCDRTLTATAQYPHLRDKGCRLKCRPTDRIPLLFAPVPLVFSLSLGLIGFASNASDAPVIEPSRPRLNIHICEMRAVASNAVPFDLHHSRLSSETCSRYPDPTNRIPRLAPRFPKASHSASAHPFLVLYQTPPDAHGPIGTFSHYISSFPLRLLFCFCLPASPHGVPATVYLHRRIL
ncbi:hypothetical protein BJY52DRAFT_1192988 [Lactarius psammicola]|nr:hypothetical protein BJY52DRAFT_1192988 [Lactarius psammicola]